MKPVGRLFTVVVVIGISCCTELLNAQSPSHFGIYYFDEKFSQLAGDGVTPLTSLSDCQIVTGTINWC